MLDECYSTKIPGGRIQKETLNRILMEINRNCNKEPRLKTVGNITVKKTINKLRTKQNIG